MRIQWVLQGCVAVLFVIASACGKDGAEITKEYRPKLEAKLAQLAAAAKDSGSKPLEKAPVDKLTFGGPKSNALVAHEAWFTGEQEDGLLTNTGAISTVKDALRGQTDGVSTYYESAFKELLSAKYLVIVKSYIVPGTVTGEGSFSGGSASGTLRFLEVETGKLVDTVFVEAKPSDEVSAREGNEAKSLESDLWFNLRQEASKALGPYLAAGQKSPL